MSRVSFARLSDAPPPLREMLDVEDDGSWTVWRSVGQAIGRLAGPADAADAAGKRILELASEAERADPPSKAEFAPDAAIERVHVGDRSATLPYRQTPDGPWGELFAACRRLLDEAIAYPNAAIGLVIIGPNRVRLEHRGDGPLPIELGSAQVEATVWREGTFVAAGRGRIDAGHVDAGPGWSMEVPLDGIDPSTDGEAVVFVSFVADDGGVYIPVTLSAGRAPG